MWAKIEFIESGERKVFRYRRSNLSAGDSGLMMGLASDFVLSIPITYGHMILSPTEPEMDGQYVY
jgi:hypothetical protein